jgi:hypothetical protein
MIDKKKITNFRERWGIGTTDQKELEKLRNRIEKLVNHNVEQLVNDADFIEHYAELLGSSIEDAMKLMGPGYIVAKMTTSYPELMESVQLLLWSLLETGYRSVAKTIALNLNRIMELSPGFDVSVLISKSDITIYPAGAKVLDENLVEKVLEWLDGYPNVGKHFYEALKIYSAKDIAKYRNLLDNLRFSLEQMLRIVLGNQKSLENQKVETLQWLASHNVHSHVTNMYNDVIGRFASYQNDAVKHNERYSSVEIEFMIYLTGTFLRLLVQLNQQGAPAKNKTTARLS